MTMRKGRRRRKPPPPKVSEEPIRIHDLMPWLSENHLKSLIACLNQLPQYSELSRATIPFLRVTKILADIKLVPITRAYSGGLGVIINDTGYARAVLRDALRLYKHDRHIIETSYHIQLNKPKRSPRG